MPKHFTYPWLPNAPLSHPIPPPTPAWSVEGGVFEAMIEQMIALRYLINAGQHLYCASQDAIPKNSATCRFSNYSAWVTIVQHLSELEQNF